MKSEKLKRNFRRSVFNAIVMFSIIISATSFVYAATSSPIYYNGVTAYGVLDVSWQKNGGTGYAKTYTNNSTTYSLGAYLTVHNESGTALGGDTVVGFDSVQTKSLTYKDATEFRSLHNIQENRVPQKQVKLINSR